MEFDETQHSLEKVVDASSEDAKPETKPEPKAPPVSEERTLDASSDEFGARFEQAGEGGQGMGFETRRQQNLIAAALFDEDPVPVRIGRFVVVRELGAGGMGVVYVAYDEQLDRRVAVKLLRGSDPDSEASGRLAREAQAMARLQHPHVVTVHEVGEFEGQVFVAMEFVEGQDLRGWMQAETQRDWREVVDIFIQAGRGLEAAHAVGLVHRDFKPDNVLVGKDGRARVADFGLAHAFDAQPRMREVGVEDSASNHLDTPLTKTGAIMGTPAYMAPEQYAGVRSDARGDQFSFCVALWEALHGRRPFSGRNLFALSQAITSGKLDAPPEDSEVPAWLRAVLARGLASDPDERWKTMGALLDALADDPQARRRRRALWGGVASAISSVVVGLSWLAVTQVQANAQHSYWSELTEQLLSIERERGLRQANDDAARARDATRMSVLRSYQPGMVSHHEDATVATILLREVEGEARESEAWLSAANELLAQQVCYQVLEGHRDTVSAVLFGPRGRALYSGSFDGEVRRWDIDSGVGEVISTHDKQVTELAATPDGKLIASSAHDHTVRLWSAERGTSEVLVQHERPVMSVDIDARGRWLASASKDGTVHLHDLRAGTERVLEGGGGAVYVVRFDPEGEQLVTGSADGKLRVWSVESGGTEPLATLARHSAAVFHVHVLDEGRIVSGSDDGSVVLWRRDRSSRELARHADAITALDVRGERAVSGAVDGSILVSEFDGSTRPVPRHGSAVWSLALTPDGEQILSGSFDGTARRVRVDGRGVPRVYAGHRQAILRIALDESGERMASASYDSDIRVWDLKREPALIELAGHTHNVMSAVRDASGSRVVTASQDGSARVWDTADGTCLHVLEGQPTLTYASFSPDGARVATADTNGGVSLWELDSGALTQLAGHEHVVWRLSFDASGSLLASAGHDGTVRLWDVRTAQLRHVLVGHEDRVMAVDLQPDGSTVASAGHDGDLRIWDAHSGELLARLEGHEGRIISLLRSPDGVTLVTGADDGSARIWPSQDPADARVLEGHGKEIWAMAFDAEGARLATTSHDTQVRVWDVATGELLELLDAHTDALWDVEFLPDGSLLTASTDQSLRRWFPGGSSLALTGQHAAVLGVELDGTGRRALSIAAGGGVRLWDLPVFTRTPEQAQAELLARTRYCLPVELRVRELGEEPREAERALARCRAGN